MRCSCRTYSNVEEALKAINEKLDKNESNDKMNILQTSLDNLSQQLTTLSKSITSNNAKLVYFFMDTIKILVPNLEKPNKNAIEHINQRLANHQLGSISTDEFTKYIDKLWQINYSLPASNLMLTSTHCESTAQRPNK